MNKKTIMNKTICILVLIFLMISPNLFARDIVSNIKSYLESDISKVAFVFNLEEMKSEVTAFEEIFNILTNPDYPQFFSNTSYSRNYYETGDYYHKLKDAGLDLFKNTDYIMGSAEELPVTNDLAEKDIDNIKHMSAMIGNYPVEPFLKFLPTSGFTKKEHYGAITFSKENENMSITLIDEKVLLMTPVDHTETVLDRLTNGTDIKDNTGSIKQFIERAEKSYNIMYMVMDLDTLGNVDMRAVKTDVKEDVDEFNSDENSMFMMPFTFDNLPDEMELKSFTFGMKTDKSGGFSLEFNVESFNNVDSKALYKAINPTLGTIKFFGPIMIGFFGEGSNPPKLPDPEDEEAKRFRSAVEKMPKLTREEQLTFREFFQRMRSEYEENNFKIYINFHEDLLLTFKKMIEIFGALDGSDGE